MQVQGKQTKINREKKSIALFNTVWRRALLELPPGVRAGNHFPGGFDAELAESLSERLTRAAQGQLSSLLGHEITLEEFFPFGLGDL